jgi:AbrB family looped-hinge helix DNA binding protein
MVIVMVRDEEAIATVDEQGRMVLPSNLREKLGLKRGGKVSIRSEDSNRIVIERRNDDNGVEARVRNWAEVALNDAPTIERARKKPISKKWMSSEYSRRKLGL